MGAALFSSKRVMALALITPPLAVFLVFFVLPLASLLWVSMHGTSQTEIYGNDLTVANYVKIATDPFYHTIILRTLGIAAVILLASLVLGYATAYLLAPLPPRRRLMLLLLLIVPLMVSNVVRAYGWTAVLGRQGLVNALLHGAGLIDRPLVMLNSFEAVAFGLMTILLRNIARRRSR
jgi:putative spermidine/putrescine transport system permease protein